MPLKTLADLLSTDGTCNISSEEWPLSRKNHATCSSPKPAAHTYKGLIRQSSFTSDGASDGEEGGSPPPRLRKSKQWRQLGFAVKAVSAFKEHLLVEIEESMMGPAAIKMTNLKSTISDETVGNIPGQIRGLESFRSTLIETIPRPEDDEPKNHHFALVEEVDLDEAFNTSGASTLDSAQDVGGFLNSYFQGTIELLKDPNVHHAAGHAAKAITDAGTQSGEAAKAAAEGGGSALFDAAGPWLGGISLVFSGVHTLKNGHGILKLHRAMQENEELKNLNTCLIWNKAKTQAVITIQATVTGVGLATSWITVGVSSILAALFNFTLGFFNAAREEDGVTECHRLHGATDQEDLNEGQVEEACARNTGDMIDAERSDEAANKMSLKPEGVVDGMSTLADPQRAVRESTHEDVLWSPDLALVLTELMRQGRLRPPTMRWRPYNTDNLGKRAPLSHRNFL